MSSMSSVEESKMHPGFYAGIGAEYAIDENWSVRLSLLFTMKGVKQDYKFLCIFVPCSLPRGHFVFITFSRSAKKKRQFFQ